MNAGTTGVALGGKLYFSGRSVTTGDEVWVSDGTDAGTRMLADTRAGAASGFSGAFGVGGSAYYFGGRSSGENTVWSTDGTPGSEEVALTPEPGFRFAGRSTSTGDALYYTVVSESGGYEIWRWDGVLARRLLGPEHATLESTPRYTVSTPTGSDVSLSLSGSLLFIATEVDSGKELWITDGTEQGTALLKDIREGPEGSIGSSAAIVGSTLFFTADDGESGMELWKTDGTEIGTVLLDIEPGPSASNPVGLIAFEGRLVFVTFGATSSKVWSSDGTIAGTHVIEEFAHDAPGGWPDRWIVSDDILFFVAQDDPYGFGRSLWMTTGAPGEARRVPGFPSETGPGPRALFAGEAGLFVSVEGAANPLWRTDGTEAGIVLVFDPGEPRFLEIVGELDGSIFFNSAGEFWKSDGTPSGTALVSDGPTRTRDSDPEALVDASGVLYFSADDGTSGRELWRSDGSETGTFQVADIAPGSSIDSRPAFEVSGTTVLFAANDGTHGIEPWRSDGTQEGTGLVLDVAPGGSSGYFGATISDDRRVWFSGRLFFRGYDGLNGVELWSTDGSAAGTQLFADLHPGSSSGGPAELTVLGNSMLFRASDPQHGDELWITDGTPLGTTLLADVRAGNNGSGPILLTAIGESLYFVADDGIHGREVWVTDATTAGTRLLKDILPGPVIAQHPGWFTEAGGRVVFIADDGVHGPELWASDGTEAGTALLMDLTPGSEGTTFGGFSRKSRFTRLGEKIVFAAIAYQQTYLARELWVSDGTSQGTQLIDLWPGSKDESPDEFHAVTDEIVVFRGNDGVHGEELWRTDGTEFGTWLVADIADPGGSLPANLTRSGDRVFFTATRADVGRELFAIPISAALDRDLDRLSDWAESEVHGTNPDDPDSDADGVLDGEEVNRHGTEPLDADTDGDGLTDGNEILRGSNPLDSSDPLPTSVPAMNPWARIVTIGLLAVLRLSVVRRPNRRRRD